MSSADIRTANGDIAHSPAPSNQKCCQISPTLIPVKILLFTFYGGNWRTILNTFYISCLL